MKTSIKKAFTLTEMLVVILLVIFMGTLSLNVLNNTQKKSEDLVVISTYDTLKKAIAKITSTDIYYPSDKDFRDLSALELDNSTIEKNDLGKFRKVLANELEINGYLTCQIYTNSSSKPGISENCMILNNGAVIGVPDTDFSKTNVYSYANSTSTTQKVILITMYPSARKIKGNVKNDYMNENAMFYAVGADGDFFIAKKSPCWDKNSKGKYIYSNYLQCRARDLLTE